MKIMWNFFSRDISREFPYDFAETYPSTPGIVCKLTKGIKKADKEFVSIFTFDKKHGSTYCYEVTRTNLKKLKTLRHPGIVTYLDSYENDDNLYIVTEFVQPLLPYLEKLQNAEKYIPWGILNVVKAVDFLNSDGELRHNNICALSVYVTEAGEWKLGEFGYVTELNGLHSSIGRDSFFRKYDPPEVIKSTSSISTSWAIDSWGLGILIWEVYNGTLTDSHSLKRLDKIPDNLKPIYCELIAAKPEKRPRSSDIIKRCTPPGEYFDNVLVRTLTFLDEIHLRNKTDVNLFFKDLDPLLEILPKSVSQYKMLPLIIRAYEYGNEASCIVQPFLKISASLEETHYQKLVVPFLIKLFSSNDRATRSILLLNLEQFIDKLAPGTINDILFPLIVNGFVDTNPRIREQTVKVMVDMVPKLSRKNVDEEVLRHLARLQSKDEQGGIRTNTTVCLGKIAHCLNPGNRAAILISAFLRAVSDPFPPVRIAGILAFAVCQQYFSLEDISKRILPSLCSLTLDQDIAVRENTFRTIKGYLSKLEKVSENPNLREEMEKEALSSKANAVGTWAEWAVTAIASKFTKSNDTKIYNQEVSTKPTPSEELFTKGPNKSLNEGDQNNQRESVELKSDIPSVDEELFEEESGWDDNWLSLSDNEDESNNCRTTEINIKTQDVTNKKQVSSGPMKLGTKISRHHSRSNE